MPVVVVVNPKGGVGKTTVSTNIAGYFASRGARVMLGDVDKQQSSRQWLADRPSSAGKIVPWETATPGKVKVPKGVTHVVLDTPAGLDGKELKGVLKMATKAVVPLQPSVFDMRATVDFMRELIEYKKLARIDIALLAMRVKENTHSLQHLRDFCEHLPFPLLGVVRDTQNYVHLAAQGMTLFDVPPGRVQRDLQQWEPICRWLDEPSRPQPSGKVDPDARY
ncbi:ParA family protein [Brachymonas chironomi]|uniref:ParA family protein n=1 Tax=Brachymonas chironomi TaxID=491919 RepID=UPI0003637C23|nr:ParA family protein [Brachymonas chironomi]